MIDHDPQFLVEFADQRRFGGLAGFDLAARKLPQTGHRRTFGTLLDEHAPVAIDQRRGDHNETVFGGFYRCGRGQIINPDMRNPESSGTLGPESPNCTAEVRTILSSRTHDAITGTDQCRIARTSGAMDDPSGNSGVLNLAKGRGRTMTKIAKLLRSTSAATAVEYGLILALIFIAAMTAISNVGSSTIAMWNNVSSASTDAM